MRRSSRPVTFTLRAFGWRASLILAAVVGFLLFGVPRLLAPMPSADAVQRLVRDLHGRQVRDAMLQPVRAAPPDSAAVLVTEMAKAIVEVNRATLTVLSVRRSWLGPPFTYRWGYFAQVQESGPVSARYYRISRGMATETSRAFYLVRLF